MKINWGDGIANPIYTLARNRNRDVWNVYVIIFEFSIRRWWGPAQEYNQHWQAQRSKITRISCNGQLCIPVRHQGNMLNVDASLVQSITRLLRYSHFFRLVFHLFFFHFFFHLSLLVRRDFASRVHLHFAKEFAESVIMACDVQFLFVTTIFICLFYASFSLAGGYNSHFSLERVFFL